MGLEELPAPSLEVLDYSAVMGIIDKLMSPEPGQNMTLELTLYNENKKPLPVLHKTDGLIYHTRKLISKTVPGLYLPAQTEVEDFTADATDAVADSRDSRKFAFLVMDTYQIETHGSLNPLERTRWKVTQGFIGTTSELPPRLVTR